MRMDFERRRSAWTMLHTWSAHMDEWMMGPVGGVSAEAVQSTTNEATKAVYKVGMHELSCW